MSKLTRALGLALLGLTLCQSARADVCGDDFEPKPENNPQACRALWEKIGLPISGDDIDATIVCHTRFVLLHNNETKTPAWVIEPLNKKQVSGTNTRPDSKKFSQEKLVCPPAKARDEDYTKSKMDRGHQAASADFSSSGELMDETFVLSNAVPQVGIGFNRGIWKEFEALVRKLTKERGELYVITGPIYADGDGNIPEITKTNNACKTEITFEAPKRPEICGAATRCEAGVAVPVGLFKIFYDPSMKRANAYVLPNKDHRRLEDPKALEYLKRFRTTVKVVERFAGFQFLPDIPGRRAQVEECVATMFH